MISLLQNFWEGYFTPPHAPTPPPPNLFIPSPTRCHTAITHWRLYYCTHQTPSTDTYSFIQLSELKQNEWKNCRSFKTAAGGSSESWQWNSRRKKHECFLFARSSIDPTHCYCGPGFIIHIQNVLTHPVYWMHIAYTCTNPALHQHTYLNTRHNWSGHSHYRSNLFVKNLQYSQIIKCDCKMWLWLYRHVSTEKTSIRNLTKNKQHCCYRARIEPSTDVWRCSQLIK